MLTTRAITVSYDRKIILSNIYLDFMPGKIYGVLGPNGAGKSTLFKAILGLVEPDSGSVELSGQPLEKQRKRVAYIPQKGDVDWQFPATVFDVVLMGRYPYRRPLQPLTKEDKLLAEKALEDTGIPHLKKRQIGELSGGQQQRVFIARALCQQAEVLLLDEPFVGVDVATEEKIIQLLHQQRDEGKMLLVVHHDLSKVTKYFDEVVFINQRLVAAGPVETAFTDDNISATFGGKLSMLNQIRI